jgi:phosphate-selective porin
MNSAKDQNTAWGFENRRTKLDFQGNVFSKDWTYRVRSNFADVPLTPGFSNLEFAYVEKAMDNGMSIRVGQFQAPWLREVLVDSSMQLAAERSIVAQLFGQGYSQGIQWGMETDSYRINAGLFDGIGGTTTAIPFFDEYNSRNTNWELTPTNYAFAGRLDYKLSGDWSQFDDFSSFKGEEAGMMLGVAAVYQRNNGNEPASSLAGDKIFGLTADFTWDFGGASLFASGVWGRYDSAASGVSNTDPWGVTVQGGYFVTEDAELFARYEYLNYDIDVVTGDDKYNGVTLGANYFFAKGVKLTVDWSWNLKSLEDGGLNSVAALNGAGFRTDEPGKDNQWALRAQLQLLF